MPQGAPEKLNEGKQIEHRWAIAIAISLLIFQIFCFNWNTTTF